MRFDVAAGRQMTRTAEPPHVPVMWRLCAWRHALRLDAALSLSLAETRLADVPEDRREPVASFFATAGGPVPPLFEARLVLDADFFANANVNYFEYLLLAHKHLEPKTKAKLATTIAEAFSPAFHEALGLRALQLKGSAFADYPADVRKTLAAIEADVVRLSPAALHRVRPGG